MNEEFRHPRLAAMYDALDGNRSDLDNYLEIAQELQAHRVLDVGCGTGTLALMLADLGLEVTGVDPAAASLAVARAKPGGQRVRWLDGDATTLPELDVDLATMTANVAMFIDDQTWCQSLGGVHRALRAGGHLVFETRDPARRAWERWNRAHTEVVNVVSGQGPVRRWCEVLDVALPWATLRWTFVFEADGQVLTSTSRLRFRGQDEVEAALRVAGFDVIDIRDAPDRPGRELVFLTRA